MSYVPMMVGLTGTAGGYGADSAPAGRCLAGQLPDQLFDARIW